MSAPHRATGWGHPLGRATRPTGCPHPLSPFRALRCTESEDPTPAPGRRFSGRGGRCPLPSMTRLDAAPLRGFTPVGSAGRSTSSRANALSPCGAAWTAAPSVDSPARVSCPPGRRPPANAAANSNRLRCTTSTGLLGAAPAPLDGGPVSRGVACLADRRRACSGSAFPPLGRGESSATLGGGCPSPVRTRSPWGRCEHESWPAPGRGRPGPGTAGDALGGVSVLTSLGRGVPAKSFRAGARPRRIPARAGLLLGLRAWMALRTWATSGTPGVCGGRHADRRGRG